MSGRYWGWFFAILLLVGCGPRADVSVPEAPVVEPMPDGGVVGEGRELYDRYCKLCHAEGGKGYASDDANQLSNSEFLSSASDGFLMIAIDQGRPGTPMAAYGKRFGGPLSHEEEVKLVLYLRSLQTVAPVALDPGPVRGDIDAGAQVFAERCASCHGGRAEGDSALSLANPVFLMSASDGYLRHAIRRGRSGTPMPAFEGELAPKAIDDVTAFLRSLTRNVPTAPRGELPPTFESAVINPGGPNPEFPPLREGRYVPAEAVKDALAKGAKMVILDARPTSEWLNSHIPGALPVPYYDPERMSAKLPQDGTWILAYCGCPHAASGRVMDSLRGRGFQNTAVIDEGIFEWIRRGYPLTYGTSPTVGAPR
ncbi:MAG: c-type cytochrome [Deltaproteobacteria bacterium]|nr:c-type cytochrome [Deltaproteobacteria bacterium]